MWDIDRPQRSEARNNRNANVQPHFQRYGIDRKASPEFTATIFDSLEVSETLRRCNLCVIRLHSGLDVCSGPHFNMKPQLRLHFTRNFIRMPAGFNET